MNANALQVLPYDLGIVTVAEKSQTSDYDSDGRGNFGNPPKDCTLITWVRRQAVGRNFAIGHDNKLEWSSA